jgi:hypothetical protein
VREAGRLGAAAERMLVPLKQCLADERLPREARELYQLYYDAAARTAIETYYRRADVPPSGDAGGARPPTESPRMDE